MGAIQKTEAHAIERAEVISEDKVELVKRTIAKGATDDELELFIATCRRLNLDPFARQIYAVKQWDGQERRMVMRSQVSIDGFRLVAERTRQYRGQTEPEWCGKDGQWVTVWLHDEPPAAARCGVYREGFAQPLYAVARWREYVQTKRDGSVNSMWRKFGPTMLHKCAEMQALRKAFPMELGGVYGTDEMGQADNDRVTRVEPQAPPEQPREEHDPETGEVIPRVPNVPLFREHAGKLITDESIPRQWLRKMVGIFEGELKREGSLPPGKQRIMEVFRDEADKRKAAEEAEQTRIDAAEREAIQAEAMEAEGEVVNGGLE